MPLKLGFIGDLLAWSRYVPKAFNIKVNLIAIIKSDSAVPKSIQLLHSKINSVA